MNRDELIDAIYADLAAHAYTALPVAGALYLHLSAGRLGDAVRTDPVISIFAGKLLNLSSWTVEVSVDSFASWLINRSAAVGPERAVDELASFLALDHTPALEILLIAGISVPHAIEVSEGVVLCPVKDVPSQELLRHFQTRQGWRLRHQMSGNSPFVLIDPYAPVTALWRKLKVTPKWLEVKGPQPAQPDPVPELKLRDICNLLTLCGPCSPAPIRHWIEPEDETPLKQFIGKAWGWPIDQMRVRLQQELTSDELAGFPEIVRAYGGLGRDVKHALTVPLQRLNRSVRHESAIDKALDLGVALEALLLPTQSERMQLSLQLRLRGAWLLGDTIDERRKVYKQLRLIYDARSGAAHAGKIDAKRESDIKLIQQAIDEGPSICARAIQAVIRGGGFPEWQDMLLGGGLERVSRRSSPF